MTGNRTYNHLGLSLLLFFLNACILQYYLSKPLTSLSCSLNAVFPGQFAALSMSIKARFNLGHVFLGKCLSGQMLSRANVFWANVFLGKYLSGQMSFWANVVWANVFWANVFLGKCLSGQMSSGQMSPWANVVWSNVSGQMSLGKCRLGKGHGTVIMYLCRKFKVHVSFY
jgi:hypothetical protein